MGLPDDFLGLNLPLAAATPLAPRLLARLRDHLRPRHYSIRTERAYTNWARHFALFHGKRHAQEMGAAEVEAFLAHLAVHLQVSASTQNQVQAGLLYLYMQVPRVDLSWLDDVVQAKAPMRLGRSAQVHRTFCLSVEPR